MQMRYNLFFTLIGTLCCCLWKINFAMESRCLKYKPDQFIMARACWLGKEDEIEKFLSKTDDHQNDTTLYNQWHVEIDTTAKIIKTSISINESVILPYDEFKAFLNDRELRQCARDLIALLK